MLPDPEALFYPKQHTLFAARAAGILPMGFVGSIADFRDQEAFRAIIRRSKRLGFMGASAIHPLQVPVLNEEFGVTRRPRWTAPNAWSPPMTRPSRRGSARCSSRAR